MKKISLAVISIITVLFSTGSVGKSDNINVHAKNIDVVNGSVDDEYDFTEYVIGEYKDFNLVSDPSGEGSLVVFTNMNLTKAEQEQILTDHKMGKYEVSTPSKFNVNNKVDEKVDYSELDAIISNNLAEINEDERVTDTLLSVLNKHNPELLKGDLTKANPKITEFLVKLLKQDNLTENEAEDIKIYLSKAELGLSEKDPLQKQISKLLEN